MNNHAYDDVDDHDDDFESRRHTPFVVSRRNALEISTAAVAATTTASWFHRVSPAAAASVADNNDAVSFQASWSSVDGLLNSDSKVVQFDYAAYKAMKDDVSRTPLFAEAILKRLESAPNGPESQVVVDLGTGPFALFAIVAAQLGAGKVYAIEGDPYAAASARSTIKKEGWSDIIEVIEGFSTDVTLPEKADFVVAEIIGSVASEEGAYATIRDAHARLVKEPNNANSWIPSRIQTYAAPASYTLHNLFGPPEFDWGRLKEPVRFNCRDPGLQLLADPVLVEDISFANIISKGGTDATTTNKQQFQFVVNADRMDENKKPLAGEFLQGKTTGQELERLAQSTSHSLSGIAFWPRLILDGNDEKIIVNSREYPNGGPKKSHWQTVLPVVSDRPIPLKGGDTVDLSVEFELSNVVSKPSLYRINGKVYG